tara:strand:- start:28735 stop:29823 length:1089 start_codon:yes stop_codon:yes gene_type:complete
MSTEAASTRQVKNAKEHAQIWVPRVHDLLTVVCAGLALGLEFGVHINEEVRNSLNLTSVNSTITLGEYMFKSSNGTVIHTLAFALLVYLVATVATGVIHERREMEGKTKDKDGSGVAHGIRYGTAAILFICMLDVVSGDYMDGGSAYVFVVAAIILGTSRQLVRGKDRTSALRHDMLVHEQHQLLTLGVLIGACVSPYGVGKDDAGLVNLFSDDTDKDLHTARSVAIALIALYGVSVAVSAWQISMQKDLEKRLRDKRFLRMRWVGNLVNLALFIVIAIYTRRHYTGSNDVWVASEGQFWMMIALLLCLSEFVMSSLLLFAPLGNLASVMPSTGTGDGSGGSLLARTNNAEFRPSQVGEINF